MVKGGVNITNIIMKLFLKNIDEDGAQARAIYGKAASVTGILCNIFLCVIKGLSGILFNSVAILADAVNNLTDAGNSAISLLGVAISSKPADEDHPYGHARVEYISCMGIAFVILYLGFSLFRTSLLKIFNPEDIDKSIISIVVLLVSIALKLWLGVFYKKIGKKINSSVMMANSKDSFNDVVSTSAVLVTTLIAIFADINLDSYAGCAVALLIIWSGICILKETLNNLLGTAPPLSLIENIVNKLRSYEGVKGIHDLVVHSYGPDKYFATVHVEVPCDEDILRSHDMIDNIERDFLLEMNINLVIHLDPIVTNDEEVNKVHHKIYDIIKGIDIEFSMHDFRMVKGETHTNLIFDVVIPASYKVKENIIKSQIENEVKNIDENYFCVITIDRNYTL